MYGKQPPRQAPAWTDARVLSGWRELDCQLPALEPVFEACAAQALNLLSPSSLPDFWRVGRQIARLGRGAEPVLAWFTHWPVVASVLAQATRANAEAEAEAGAAVLPDVWALIQQMNQSPNSAAIAPLMESLVTVAQRLHTVDAMRQYLRLIQNFMVQTTTSIHGRQLTQPSPGLLPLLRHMPQLLAVLSLHGLQQWMHYGTRVHAGHPHNQAAYFSLRSDESQAVLQREREGTRLGDMERALRLSDQAFWQSERSFFMMPSEHTGVARTSPCVQGDAFGLPDVLVDVGEVPASMRYRLMHAHLAGHRAWSATCVADNWSPTQRLAVEAFEDARIDVLLMRQWPGLRSWFLRLLPAVQEGACDASTHACLRHRLALWTRAVLDPHFQLQDANLRGFVTAFQTAMAERTTPTTADMARLALHYVARTRQPSDQLTQVFFEGTQIDWRDDNRHLWRFIEDGDEEDNPARPSPTQALELSSLPPQLYPEWDYLTQTLRPAWVKLYECLHPSTQAGVIDQLLQQHRGLTQRLMRALQQLQPQGRERIRHLEHGSELDADMALQAWVDWSSGHTPDVRVEQYIQPRSRDVAVQLVMDLSASLGDKVAGGEQTVLQVSQAAVALLAWALDCMGDPLALGGFYSDTREHVRYMHLKGFDETWDDTVKARLAAIVPSGSTRMGAALRHASRTLVRRPNAKKLLLILTDGEPSDVDVRDPCYLREDTRKAVQDIQAEGVFVWCIQLHATHDETVRAMYGAHVTLVDQIERLPEHMVALLLRILR
ncbi:VWA domain-containing protein [Limnohabitans sp.]|uniref:nitric oxide reductase activation protein NorD n=1 Tax=Limnohabitans sp. TaxID=1907725 RepID=UPI00286ED7C5|nr:VWA domain-containing protein [Limnohabitans sp.]